MHHLLVTHRFWSHIPRLAVACITCLAMTVASVGRAEGLKEINPPAEPVELLLNHGVTTFRGPGHPFRFYQAVMQAEKPMPRVFLCGAHLDAYPPVWAQQAVIIKDADHASRAVHQHDAVKIRTQKIEKHVQERLWRPLMAGFAALSHHRTRADGARSAGGPGSGDDNHASNTYLDGGLGLEQDARRNIKAMRAITDVVLPWETSPRQDLLTKRADDEVYLWAKVGEVYGLYFVDTGSVELKLAGVSGTFRLRWIDIAKGGYTGTEQTLIGGSTVTITTPGSTTGGWAATIVKK